MAFLRQCLADVRRAQAQRDDLDTLDVMDDPRTAAFAPFFDDGEQPPEVPGASKSSHDEHVADNGCR
jgi:hypothetical protein